MKHKLQRVFTALDLEADDREWLAGQLNTRLPRPLPEDVRPIPQQNWHVTLHFHGALPANEVRRLIEQLQQTATHECLRIAKGQWADLPQHRARKRSGVRVLLLQNEEPLLALREQLPAMGVAATEIRYYLPHISVARFRERAMPPFPDSPEYRFHFRRLVLFQSLPTPTGVRYESLWCRRLSCQA